MARTINRVELLGRVGAEPEMRYTSNGTAVTNLSLATDRQRKDGESTTDWHRVVCWAKLAETINQYVAKGDRLYVTGRLVYDSYEAPSTGSGQATDGQRRYYTEVHARDVVFLDSRNGQRDTEIESDAGAQPSPNGQEEAIASPF